MKYKVKRFWWMWALGLLFNFIAIMALTKNIALLAWIMLAIDIFFILPDALVTSYILEKGSLTVKRLIYPDIVVLYTDITEISPAQVLNSRGALSIAFGFKADYGVLQLSYTQKKKRHSIRLSVKKRNDFLDEFLPHIKKGNVFINIDGWNSKKETDKNVEQREERKKYK